MSRFVIFKVLFLAFLLSILFAGCTESALAPQFEPEVSNKTDSFEFQASGLTGITETLKYNWSNTGVKANINQSTTTSGGTATLVLRDVSNLEVYNRNLSENGTFFSQEGQTGTWEIVIVLNDFHGTINFRVEKNTN